MKQLLSSSAISVMTTTFVHRDLVKYFRITERLKRPGTYMFTRGESLEITFHQITVFFTNNYSISLKF